MRLKTLFADRSFWRSALRLALPIALQNLLLSSFTLVDTVMIGPWATSPSPPLAWPASGRG